MQCFFAPAVAESFPLPNLGGQADRAPYKLNILVGSNPIFMTYGNKLWKICTKLCVKYNNASSFQIHSRLVPVPIVLLHYLKVHKHEIFLNFFFDLNQILKCPW